MSENEVGDRGSKSAILPRITVKEQRVNGSLCNNPLYIRCTLMGFERNHQVKIPSNQKLKIRQFSSNAASSIPSTNNLELTLTPLLNLGL